MKTIPLFGVVHTPEMETAAVEVMRSGRIAAGEHVARFEAGLATLLGHEHVVTTADMTSAIALALHLAGVRAGDDVLTSAFACMSTNSAIAAIGARPVWVDIAAGAAHLDVADFAAAVTPRARAAILYHVAGYPGPAPEIARICAARGISLIEDCDNALMASVDGKPVGGFGDFGVYSFYPNRQINTTEGGALVCRSAEAAARARKLRRFGIDAASFRDSSGEISPSSDIPEVGWSVTLNNLCSALGLAQLDQVGARLARTRANALALRQRLAGIAGLRIIAPTAGAEPAYWALLVAVEGRDGFLAQLKAQGIQASKLHQRNDIYSCFIACERALPNTAEFQRTVAALPCGWWLEPADLDHIVEVATAAMQGR